MSVVFDLDKLNNLLKDLYSISGIRTVVLDVNQKELTSYPPTAKPFCSLISGSKLGQEKCRKCDADAIATLSKKKKLHIYRCHAGLTEAAVPLYDNNVLVGYMMFGQVSSYLDAETGWASIQALCKDIPVDAVELKKAFFECPAYSIDYIRSAANILYAAATYLTLERMAAASEDSLVSKIDRWISEHYSEQFKVDRICEIFGIGKTKLYDISKTLYNCGIYTHIRQLRLEKAENLLLSSGKRISDIAAECGFSDYNYFIAVFTKAYGISPAAFRKSRKKDA